MSPELLFFTLCIPLRIIFALLPNYKLIEKYIPIKMNKKLFYQVVGIIFLCIAFGLLYLYFTNERLYAYMKQV